MKITIMKTLFIKTFLSLAIFNLISCRSEDSPNEDLGVKTKITGYVKNEITNESVSDYKIVLEKGSQGCSNFGCGWSLVEVNTAYTNELGYYEIDFDYKLENKEIYSIDLKQKENFVVSEIQSSNGIVAGKDNRINVNIWKPIKIVVNASIINNKKGPLIIGNKLVGKDEYLFGTHNTYEENISKIITLLTKPNSNIDLDVWYYENYNSSNPIKHQKKIQLQTKTSDMNFDLNIDCSTF